MAPTFLHPVSASLFDAPGDHPRISARLRSALRRVYAAMIAMRRAQAEREVARFIEARGGRLTDDLEREISHRFTTPIV